MLKLRRPWGGPLIVFLAVVGLWALSGTAVATTLDTDPEVPAIGDLTDGNRGDLVIEKSGSRVTIQSGADKIFPVIYAGTDDEVYTVGWQEPQDGAVSIDLSLMPAGEVTVAVLDASGELAGWGVSNLSEEESNAISPAAQQESPQDSPAAGESKAADRWGWALVGVVIVATALLALRRHRMGQPGEKSLATTERGGTHEG